MERDYQVPILKRTIAVIDFISEHTEGVTFVELVNALNTPKTTVFRILHTLEKNAWVNKNGDRYFLGYMMIHYGLLTLSRRNLRQVAFPFLKKLMEATQETSHLTVLSGKKSMILEVCDSSEHIKMSSPIGTLLPLYCTSHGKVLLAYGIEEDLEDFLAGVDLERRTKNTLTTISELKSEVKKIRENGYSIDELEYFENVRCCAAPVLGQDGKLMAAVGITATTMTFTEDRIGEISDKVVNIARQISREMGNIR